MKETGREKVKKREKKGERKEKIDRESAKR